MLSRATRSQSRQEPALRTFTRSRALPVPHLVEGELLVPGIFPSPVTERPDGVLPAGQDAGCQDHVLVVTHVEQRTTRIWIDQSGARRQSQRLAAWKHIDSPPTRGIAQSSTSKVTLITVMGGAAGFAAWLFYTPNMSAPQSFDPQEIRMIVPPPESERDLARPMAAGEALPAPRPTPASAVPAPMASPAVPASLSVPQQAEPRQEYPQRAELQGPEEFTMAAASERAISSGSVENWSEGGREGFVSAGATVLRNGQPCREITTWERGGAQGEAKTAFACKQEDQQAE